MHLIPHQTIEAHDVFLLRANNDQRHQLALLIVILQFLRALWLS